LLTSSERQGLDNSYLENFFPLRQPGLQFQHDEASALVVLVVLRDRDRATAHQLWNIPLESQADVDTSAA
jgi:hypothetical protein